MEREQLRFIRDAIRSLDYVDERIFEETSTLDHAYESARYDGKPLDLMRVRRVREALPDMLSAISGAMASLDLAFRLTEGEEA